MESLRPNGNIKTVLDLAERDGQDDFFTPLTSEQSWFSRTTSKTIPFTPTIQTFPYRGPAAFGSTFAVTLDSLEVGDLLHYIGVQIQLDSWLKSSDVLRFLSGEYTHTDPASAWTWANSLGTILIENAYIQIGDTVIERIDSTFTSIFNTLFPTINEQFGFATDALGTYSQTSSINPNRPFTTENGQLLCILPFWFSRTRYHESLPLIGCAKGSVQLYITFRPFDQVVRQIQKYRASCASTPLNQTITVTQEPNINNTLQAATIATSSYYNATTQTYTIPLLSPSFQRQNMHLDQPVTTVLLGISSSAYASAPYLSLAISAAAAMNLSTITFYNIENSLLTFIYTLPSSGITTSSAVLNFTNITVTPDFTITFGSAELLQQSTTTITTLQVQPAFQNIQILTYSSLLDGPMRDKLMRQPYDMLYREVNNFSFTEPLKYTIVKPNSATDNTTVSLSLECNGPCEEILWVIRRRGCTVNNEWTNFTPLLEMQQESGRYPMPLLEACSIWVNGTPLIEQDGDWFRQHIASKHGGGIVAWNRYIYGYSFARHPGQHQPSGTINTSRATSIQLRLTVRSPAAASLPDGFDKEISNGWEVFAYCVSLNWLRFQNGIANRIYSA